MGLIVVDTSALLAIIQKEPECDAFLQSIRDAERVFVSAFTMFEANVVLHARRGAAGTDELGDLVDGMGLDIVAFDRAIAELALGAFRSFGKGQHAQARLNLGDCASYALAKGMNAALLFKGDDFTHTDIVAAIP
jgi:ribonuclease VapC